MSCAVLARDQDDSMEPKRYNPTTILQLRLVDVTLTFGVISGLGELSGDDIELLYHLREKLRAANPPTEQFQPAQRTDPAFLHEVDLEVDTSQVQFMRQLLYSRLKCFAAGDMDHVVEVRRRLDESLRNAEKSADD